MSEYAPSQLLVNVEKKAQLVKSFDMGYESHTSVLVYLCTENRKRRSHGMKGVKEFCKCVSALSDKQKQLTGT